MFRSRYPLGTTSRRAWASQCSNRPRQTWAIIVFAVTVTEKGVINNTVTIDDGLDGLTERSATTMVLPYNVYLPLLMKNYGP